MKAYRILFWHGPKIPSPIGCRLCALGCAAVRTTSLPSLPKTMRCRVDDRRHSHLACWPSDRWCICCPHLAHATPTPVLWAINAFKCVCQHRKRMPSYHGHTSKVAKLERALPSKCLIKCLNHSNDKSIPTGYRHALTFCGTWYESLRDMVWIVAAAKDTSNPQGQGTNWRNILDMERCGNMKLLQIGKVRRNNMKLLQIHRFTYSHKPHEA